MELDVLSAHVCFTTTAAPAAPTVLRQYRATVARNAALVGRYLVDLTDPIADRDLEVVASVSNTGLVVWLDAKVTRVTDTQYEITVWDDANQLLNAGLTAYGSRFGTTPEANLVAGAAAVFETVGPLFGGVTSPSTSRLLLPRIGNYKVSWSLAFTTASELGLFADPNTGVFALVPGSVSITGTDAAAIGARNTNSITFTTTAINTLIELRNVGTADEVYTPADAVLNDEPSFFLDAQLLSESESVTVQSIALSDTAGANVRLTFRKVNPG